jgi:hypothetical protein
MWNKEYIVLPLLSIPLLLGNDGSFLLFMISIILILVRIKARRMIYAKGIQDNLSVALKDWGVAILTRSAITVLFERYRVYRREEDRKEVSKVLRGYPTVHKDEGLYMKGTSPSAKEIAFSTSEEKLRFLSNYKASIETRLGVLQAISFFIPVLLLLFLSDAFSTIVNQVYAAIDYSLIVLLARTLLVREL